LSISDDVEPINKSKTKQCHCEIIYIRSINQSTCVLQHESVLYSWGILVFIGKHVREVLKNCRAYFNLSMNEADSFLTVGEADSFLTVCKQCCTASTHVPSHRSTHSYIQYTTKDNNLSNANIIYRFQASIQFRVLAHCALFYIVHPNYSSIELNTILSSFIYNLKLSGLSNGPDSALSIIQ
jgi:hypothetical protein